jgi:serine/threonine-protein kinase
MDEASAAIDPLIGKQVGNYQIRHKLGEGGMGSVYLAEHPRIGKKVALKILHAEFTANQDVTTRFFNEARAVNDIGHPNIVDIMDFGQIEGGSVYFIMEFLQGRSLAQVIRDEAPLAPDRALAISLQIADALAASHRHRIVHRDLKPDNIILQPRGSQTDFVKVLDFGIAKLTGDQPGSHRTRTGIVMGTPAYMSPEQCEGKGQVDHRTDVYALGIVLYEMLTGQVPFQGEGYGEVLVQHLTAVPQRPSTLRLMPAHIEAVCLKALEKRPGQRYASMDDFIQALRDPVGYVEAGGGVAGFLSLNLGAPTINPTPPPGHLPMATPVPGTTPMPGSGVYAAQVPPTVMRPSMGHPTVAGGAPGGSKKGLMFGAIGALVALGVGGAIAFKSMGGEETPAAIAAANKPATPSAGEPAAAGKVTIDVRSMPAGAEVRYAGELMGNTPVKFEVDRGDASVKLVVRLPGYVVREEPITPSQGRRFDLNLERESTPTPVEPVATPTAPTPTAPTPPTTSPPSTPTRSSRTTRSTKPPRRPTPPTPDSGKKPSRTGNNTLEPDF